MEFSKAWVNHLRNASRQDTTGGRSPGCPLCKAELPQPDLASFIQHVKADLPAHPNLTTDADIEEVHRSIVLAPGSEKKTYVFAPRHLPLLSARQLISLPT
jgi:hypothetical protein